MKMSHGSKPDCQSICREYRQRLQQAHGDDAIKNEIFAEMNRDAFVAIHYYEADGFTPTGHSLFVFNDRSWLEINQ
jgi:hypothetical protein